MAIEIENHFVGVNKMVPVTNHFAEAGKMVLGAENA